MSKRSSNFPAWITCEYLQKMLQNSLKNNSIRVNDFNIGPGSSEGDGYGCQIFRIKCDYTAGTKKESRSIIAKAVPRSDSGELIMDGSNLFHVEVKFFTETLPLLYEELTAKNETEPFFPFFYDADTTNKILFMEDLKAEGYVLPDKRSSLDLDSVLLVIKSIAKMHASSYLLLKKNPEYKNNYLDCDGDVEKIITGMNKCFLKSVESWPISEGDKEIFRKLNFFDLMCESYERKDSSFNVLLHGDCWKNNMMFKFENGKPISVKLLDYELATYNSIGLDIVYFLFTSSKENVKVEHLEDVFKTYYDTFVSITGKIEGFSIDTVRKEFIERLGFGFSVGCLFRPGNIQATPVDVVAYTQGLESERNDKIFQNEEYISEVIRLLPLFKKHGVFK